MKNHIKHWYNNISLYKKIILVVLLPYIIVAVVLGCAIGYLIQSYNKELYTQTARCMDIVSSSISNHLSQIEELSLSIMSDPLIQDSLYQLDQNSDDINAAHHYRELYSKLYTYMYRYKHVKSINIVLNNGYHICSGISTDIDSFDIDTISQTLSNEARQPLWFGERSAGNSVMCAREFKRLKYVKLNKMAGLYIILDMDALILDILNRHDYPVESKDFILLDKNVPIYPELADQKQYDQMSRNTKYQIATINGEKSFLISGTIARTGWHYLYRHSYTQLFRNIRILNTLIIVISVLSVFFCILACVWMIRKMLHHLDFLMDKIRCFGQKLSVPDSFASVSYQDRNDEIAQLHKTFDEMMQNVHTLRDENYTKQIHLRDTQLKMLQQQVNPHFLYNTLDTINWIALQKYRADDISDMVQALGTLFRTSITEMRDLLPLEEELKVLDNYLLIQKIRFHDRLDFHLDIPQNISHILVPKLCIQPLVENAIKYALENSDDLCLITVTVVDCKDTYNIEVANSGSMFENDLLNKLDQKIIIPEGSGIGLINIRSRLQLLYDTNYKLEFFNKNGMAIVSLTIPHTRKETISYVESNHC
ncbi:MAG: histidine kinase [Clostridiales bacterium]|nr:histidine kinase [Clostridiales bacterium]